MTKWSWASSKKFCNFSPPKQCWYIRNLSDAVTDSDRKRGKLHQVFEASFNAGRFYLTKNEASVLANTQGQEKRQGLNPSPIFFSV
jgi:hypothetical protein